MALLSAIGVPLCPPLKVPSSLRSSDSAVQDHLASIALRALYESVKAWIKCIGRSSIGLEVN